MVWSDINKPNIVYLYKGNNPLECYYSREYDAFLYGSTVGTVRKSKVRNLQHVPIAKNTLIEIDSRTLRYKKASVKIKAPIYNNRIYNDKIGAYEKPKTAYGHTTKRFVPRFSYRDQLSMFKKEVASDGSTIIKYRSSK